MNPYDPDGYRTVTFRADRFSRSAVPENLGCVHVMDTVVVVVTGLRGADVSKLVFGAVAEDPPAGADGLLTTCGPWSQVPGDPSRAYAVVGFDSAAAVALAASLPPGRAAAVRAYLSEDGGRTLLDCACEFYDNPVPSAEASAPADAYVRKSALAAAMAQVSAMPVSSGAQAAAKLNALVSALAGLASS